MVLRRARMHKPAIWQSTSNILYVSGKSLLRGYQIILTVAQRVFADWIYSSKVITANWHWISAVIYGSGLECLCLNYQVLVLRGPITLSNPQPGSQLTAGFVTLCIIRDGGTGRVGRVVTWSKIQAIYSSLFASIVRVAKLAFSGGLSAAGQQLPRVTKIPLAWLHVARK